MKKLTIAHWAAIALLGSAAAAASSPEPVQRFEDGIWLDNASGDSTMHVRLHWPDGHIERSTLPAGGALMIDEAWLGQQRPDGQYHYEVMVVDRGQAPAGPRLGLPDGRDWAGASLAHSDGSMRVISGTFRVTGGMMLTGVGVEEEVQP